MRILRSILPLLVGALTFVVLSSAPEVIYSFRGVLQDAAVTITLLTPTWEALIVAVIAACTIWVLVGKWLDGDLLVETPEAPAPPREEPRHAPSGPEPAEEQVLRDQKGRRPHQAVQHAIMQGPK